MKTVTSNRNYGIQWTLLTQLDDLHFADDLALLSHNKKQMQNKTDLLKVVSEKTGLKINKGKTEVMKINTSVTTPITVVGEHVKEVESFVYLGSVVDKKGGTDQDVKARVGKARGAFVLLKKIWGSTEISTGTKLRIFNSNVKLCCCTDVKRGVQQRHYTRRSSALSTPVFAVSLASDGQTE